MQCVLYIISKISNTRFEIYTWDMRYENRSKRFYFWNTQHKKRGTRHKSRDALYDNTAQKSRCIKRQCIFSRTRFLCYFLMLFDSNCGRALCLWGERKLDDVSPTSMIGQSMAMASSIKNLAPRVPQARCMT